MSIDTGLLITFNPSYPVSGINQTSQQFRDNFSIIKMSIEKLQSAINTSGSVLSFVPQQSTEDGTINYALTFLGNSFTLPIGNPGITALAGMIQYNNTNGCLQFYNGAAWVGVVNQTTSVIAGNGLSGGGTLNGNVTLNLSANLNNLADVNLGTLSEGDTLYYDTISGKFVNHSSGSVSASTIVVSGGGNLQADLDSILSTLTTTSTNASNALTLATAAAASITSINDSISTFGTGIISTTSLANAANTLAGTANTTANNAYELATEVNTAVSGIETTITSIQNNLTDALANASTSMTDASNALTIANTATSSIDAVNEVLTTVQGNISALTSGLSTTDGNIASLAVTVNNTQILANNTSTTVGTLQTSVTSLQSLYAGVEAFVSGASAALSSVESFIPPSITNSVVFNIPSAYADIPTALATVVSAMHTPGVTVILQLANGVYNLSSVTNITSDLSHVQIVGNTTTTTVSAISVATTSTAHVYDVTLSVAAVTGFVVNGYVQTALLGSGNLNPINGLWPISAVGTSTVTIQIFSLSDISTAGVSGGNVTAYGSVIKTTGDGFVISGKLGGIFVPIVGPGALSVPPTGSESLTNMGIHVTNTGVLLNSAIVSSYINAVQNEGKIDNVTLVASASSNGLVNDGGGFVRGSIVVTGCVNGVINTTSDLFINSGLVSGNTAGIVNQRSARLSLRSNNNVYGNVNTNQLVSTNGAQADIYGTTIVCSPSVNTFGTDGAFNYA